MSKNEIARLKKSHLRINKRPESQPPHIILVETFLLLGATRTTSWAHPPCAVQQWGICPHFIVISRVISWHPDAQLGADYSKEIVKEHSLGSCLPESSTECRQTTSSAH